MANIVITFYTDSFTLDLGDVSTDRTFARIRFGDVRSLTKFTDSKTVEIVFSSGEIHGLSYELVDDIDGDTAITTQQILYDKMDAKLFIP